MSKKRKSKFKRRRGADFAYSSVLKAKSAADNTMRDFDNRSYILNKLPILRGNR